jgi:Nucleoside 2-deoxyribosyltransferase
MKVYIAGSSDEHEKRTVLALMDIVRTNGHVVAVDWPNCEGLKRDCTPAEKRMFARNDLDGVRACDVFWLVAPAAPSEGAHVELGGALILRKRALVSGPHARRTAEPFAKDRLFSELAEIYDTHEAALAALFGASSGAISLR